jgi:hypothetical protein
MLLGFETLEPRAVGGLQHSPHIKGNLRLNYDVLLGIEGMSNDKGEDIPMGLLHLLVAIALWKKTPNTRGVSHTLWPCHLHEKNILKAK